MMIRLVYMQKLPMRSGYDNYLYSCLRNDRAKHTGPWFFFFFFVSVRDSRRASYWAPVFDEKKIIFVTQ